MILSIPAGKIRTFSYFYHCNDYIIVEELPLLMSSFSARRDVSVPIIVLLLIIPVLVIEWLHRNEGRSSRNGRRTQRLLFGVIIANTTFALATLLSWTVCLHCPGQITSFFVTRLIMKAMNALFLIHRAKLAQGMQPILRAKCFDRILPICISTFFGILALFAPVESLFNVVWECQSYRDTNVFHNCWKSEVTEEEDEFKRKQMGVFLCVDFFITAFLLMLFIVPLYRVYKTNLGMLNENQQKQRAKLRNLLIWSVVLTFINQVTSSFFGVHVVFGSSTGITALLTVGKMDPFINVWASWLMITRNRQYLRNKLQIRCCSTSGFDRSVIQSAFTDVDSRTASRTSSRQWIRIPSTF